MNFSKSQIALALLIALGCSPQLLAAGIDTPPGVADLPLQVEGMKVLDLTQGNTAVTGNESLTGDLKANGNIGALGTVNTGTVYTVNTGCGPVGARGYDVNNDFPLYCNRNNIWVREGGTGFPANMQASASEQYNGLTCVAVTDQYGNVYLSSDGGNSYASTHSQIVSFDQSAVYGLCEADTTGVSESVGRGLGGNSDNMGIGSLNTGSFAPWQPR